jgi:hypothetical protein
LTPSSPILPSLQPPSARETCRTLSSCPPTRCPLRASLSHRVFRSATALRAGCVQSICLTTDRHFGQSA